MNARVPILTPDDIDFAGYLQESDAKAKVRPAASYLGQVLDLLAQRQEPPLPARLPFGASWLEFRTGEVSAWSGFNDSGKSMLNGQVLGGMASKGIKCCIASFEMKPARTLQRMVRQALGSAEPTEQAVTALLIGWSQHLWLYDQQGSVQPKQILAVVRYCAHELGVEQFAIDSMLKCIRGEDDYNGQKDFVDSLTVAARDFQTHIHLVMHLKKGEGDERMPTRMDIRGSGAISDLVDNVLIVWRNKRKERDRDQGKQIDQRDPDAVLICDKQRNGDWEGRQKLWYRRDTMQFTDSMHGG